jgi:hypothetical protein
MLILKSEQDNSFTKPQQEKVEQEKIEHKFIGSFHRTAGLKFYSYNILKDELIEVEERFDGDIWIVLGEDDKAKGVEVGHYKAIIDTRNEHFEALNWANAERKVKRFKQGKIKNLNNLKPPKKNKIKLY